MSNQPEPLDVDTIEARARSATSHSFLCDSNHHFNFILQAKTDIQLLVSEVRRLREREAKSRGIIADFERQGRVYPGMTVYRLKEILDA